MKFLFALAAFCIFFSSPNSALARNFSNAVLVAEHSSGAGVLLAVPAEAPLGEESESDADDESETSKTAMEDDENVVHFPAFVNLPSKKLFFDRHGAFLPDGIARRLFKPPKA